MKLGYPRAVARDWLVLETRISCTFPREELTEKRITNWGVGIGLEMYFGASGSSRRVRSPSSYFSLSALRFHSAVVQLIRGL